MTSGSHEHTSTRYPWSEVELGFDPSSYEIRPQENGFLLRHPQRPRLALCELIETPAARSSRWSTRLGCTLGLVGIALAILLAMSSGSSLGIWIGFGVTATGFVLAGHKQRSELRAAEDFLRQHNFAVCVRCTYPTVRHLQFDEVSRCPECGFCCRFDEAQAAWKLGLRRLSREIEPKDD